MTVVDRYQRRQSTAKLAVFAAAGTLLVNKEESRCKHYYVDVLPSSLMIRKNIESEFETFSDRGP